MKCSKGTSAAGRILTTLLIAALFGSSADSQVQFLNVAPQTGTTDKSLGRGSAWIDLDGDGLLDLINANAGMHMAWFRQRPDHSFEDAATIWSVPQDNRKHWVPLVADYDNDGDGDIYIASGGRATMDANQLLRNDISQVTHQGSLVDVTAAAKDAGFAGTSHGATALDYDRDGLVDVFVGAASGYSCTLLHNDGGLVFTDVSASAGIDAPGNHRACGAGDIDNDGWPDVGVAGFETVNRLFHNQTDGSFLDIAASAGVANLGELTFGMVFDDYDNDGWLDLFLPALDPGGPPSRIYRNEGNLSFSEALDLGSYQSMGHSAGDVDADGIPDVYLGTGKPSGKSLDRLLRIFEAGPSQLGFEDISVSSGIQAEGPTRCHGLAFADYDGDGDLDIYANNGGPLFPKDEDGFLWQSQGTPNAWVGVDLVGVRSNRSAIGARAMAITASGRQVHLLRSSGKGFGNCDAPTLHFGLGQESQVARIDVRWPSGVTQVLLSPAIQTRHGLVETGLGLPQDSVGVGGKAVLEACGRAGFQVELLVSQGPGLDLPLPLLGGILELLPPLVLAASFPLDAFGLGNAQIAIPAKPGLSGQGLSFQAWIHAPDTLTHSTLSNVVELLIE